MKCFDLKKPQQCNITVALERVYCEMLMISSYLLRTRSFKCLQLLVFVNRIVLPVQPPETFSQFESITRAPLPFCTLARARKSHDVFLSLSANEIALFASPPLTLIQLDLFKVISVNPDPE